MLLTSSPEFLLFILDKDIHFNENRQEKKKGQEFILNFSRPFPFYLSLIYSGRVSRWVAYSSSKLSSHHFLIAQQRFQEVIVSVVQRHIDFRVAGEAGNAMFQYKIAVLTRFRQVSRRSERCQRFFGHF